MVHYVHNVSFLTHTNPLFFKFNLSDLQDIVKYQTVLFMYNICYNLLLKHLQRMFYEIEGGHNLRGTPNFKICRIWTTVKRFCISVPGVKQWNKLSLELNNVQPSTSFPMKNLGGNTPKNYLWKGNLSYWPILKV